MKIFNILLILIGLNSCNTQSSSDQPSNDQLPNESYSKAPEYFDYSSARFKEEKKIRAKHLFSNNKEPDEFNIQINKGLITESTSRILISKSNGDTIYFDEFPTYYFINGYALETIKTNKEILNHIVERANQNVEEKSFLKIKSTSHLIFESRNPEDYYDSETFSYCLKNDLFIYSLSLGEESTTYFGYSDKKDKAITIIDCC